MFQKIDTGRYDPDYAREQARVKKNAAVLFLKIQHRIDENGAKQRKDYAGVEQAGQKQSDEHPLRFIYRGRAQQGAPEGQDQAGYRRKA